MALGIEAFLIVFSVLLALVLDEMRQGIADRKLVARVQETIHDELARNRSTVAERLPYHKAILRSTQSFIRSDSFSKRRPGMDDLGIVRGKGMAMAGDLGKTGWELALVSGALEHMDYEMLVEISKAYTVQDEEEKERNEVVRQVISINDGEGNLEGELTSFSAMMVDMVLREQELLAEYDRALAMTGR